MAKYWRREIQNPQISSQIQSFSRAIIFTDVAAKLFSINCGSSLSDGGVYCCSHALLVRGRNDLFYFDLRSYPRSLLKN
jgi:hypothetical protein